MPKPEILTFSPSTARGTCDGERARRHSRIRRATVRACGGRRRQGPHESACRWRPCHCLSARSRDRPYYSPALDGEPRRFNYTFVTEFRLVGNSTIRRIFQIFQYLSTAAPQVKPPPIASSTTMSPRLIRPSLTAVSNASGTDAAEVLACWSTVTTTFSGGRPNFFAVASRMRALAWCGTTQSTSADAKSRRREHLGQHLGEIDDGMAEHFAALHPEFADRAGGRGAAVDEQQIVVAAVGVELGREDSAFAFLRAQNERAGAVAEQDTGRSVLPVEDPAERLGPDDERLAGIARRAASRRRRTARRGNQCRPHERRTRCSRRFRAPPGPWSRTTGRSGRASRSRER